MQIAHKDSSARIGALEHRKGGLGFISLLTGESGAKDNFEFCLVQLEDNYDTPQHQHNFDQVRVMLEGEFGYAKGKVQQEGTIGYFCEGTYYQQKGQGAALTLLLQCSGASHSNYLSLGDLKRATEELSKNGKGTFQDGVYTWFDEEGRKHNQDGWEAAWEYQFNKPVTYPKPKFEAPVIMNPDNFAWVASDIEGVSVRHLGSFNERHLSVGQIRMEAGANFELPHNAFRRLLFVYEGSGAVGEELLNRHSAVQVDVGESTTVSAQSELTLLCIGLPRYEGSPTL